MRHFRFLYRAGGNHVHLDVRVGAQAHTTHGLAGTLTLTLEEFGDWQTAWEWAVNRGEAEFINAQHRYGDAE